MPSPLRFLLGRLGVGSSGAQTGRRLVSIDDLPGDDWRLLEERSWRTGRESLEEPWAQRAVSARSVTAWRSFRSGDRWLWSQLVPLVTPEDSRAALKRLPSAMLANVRSRVQVTSEFEKPGVAVPGADATWAYEQRTSGDALAGTSLLLAWTLGADLVVAHGSGKPDWAWADMLELATIQRGLLATSG